MKDLIIPDVHGRVFWKDILPFLHTDIFNKYIFLGDYLDPYMDEGFSRTDAIKVLLDIIELKRMYPNKIVLLLGNHDLGYIHSSINTCRRDYIRENIIRSIFTEFDTFFDLLYEQPIENKDFNRVLYSHAGFTIPFFEKIKLCLPKVTLENLVTEINLYWHYNKDVREHSSLAYLLSEISYYRGGDAEYGSFVWADADEHRWYEPELEKTIQIFGHSQQSSSPVITKYCACLDVRQVFSYDYDTLEFKTLHEEKTS